MSSQAGQGLSARILRRAIQGWCVLFLMAFSGGPVWAANNAVTFDGLNDHVAVTATAVLKPSTTVAVEAWVKTTVTDSAGADVVSMGDSYILRIQPNGFPRFIVYSAGSWVGTTATPGAMNDGVWHHLVGQKTPTALEVYIDGVLRGSMAMSGTIAYTLGTGCYLGKHGFNGTTFDYAGVLDEVRIYNRALTPAEITAHYASGQGQYGAPESGLVAGWHLDETSGTTTADYSGNGRTGTLVNGPTWTVGKVLVPTSAVATPTITPNGGLFASSVSVTLATTTAGATLRYTTNGTTPTGVSSLYTAPFTLTTTATVKAKAYKNGFLESAVASAGFTKDTTPPTGTVTIDGGAARTNTPAVTLTLAATDNTGPVAQMQFSHDGVTYSASQAYATSAAWTLTAGDGTKTVYAKFKDAVGNWSAAATKTIILDTTPPQIHFTAPVDGAVIIAQ